VAIRKQYAGLSKLKFKKYVTAEKKNIPTYPKVNQEEIWAKWQKDFPDDPNPLAEEVVEPPKPPDTLTPEQEEGLMKKMIDKSELNRGTLCVPCANKEGGAIFRNKCDGLNGLDGCKSREGCPTWEPWDKREG
jgi:hypothetical protein